MKKRLLTIPLLLSYPLNSCSTDKKIENKRESGPNQSTDYCPYEVDAAEDSSAFISDLAGNWVYGTRVKVDEEGPFKDTYVQSGFEIRAEDQQMMDVKLRFPNLTQKSTSLVEALTRFNFKDLKISAPIKTDDGEFRVMIFSQTEGSLGKFDCAVTAMKRDKDASGRQIVLVKGWEYNRSSTTNAQPELKSLHTFLKEKGTSTYYRHDAGTAGSASGSEGTTSTPPTNTAPAGPSTPAMTAITIDNAPFSHLSFLRFDPKNVQKIVPTEIITECGGRNWVVRFNETEMLQAPKSTRGYTDDFAACEKLNITLKSDTISPTMKTYKLLLDHRAIWKLDNQGDGEVMIDIQKILTEAQLQQ
jgi:hypothetical protein